jgi:hypothetical protein
MGGDIISWTDAPKGCQLYSLNSRTSTSCTAVDLLISSGYTFQVAEVCAESVNVSQNSGYSSPSEMIFTGSITSILPSAPVVSSIYPDFPSFSSVFISWSPGSRSAVQSANDQTNANWKNNGLTNLVGLCKFGYFAVFIGDIDLGSTTYNVGSLYGLSGMS